MKIESKNNKTNGKGLTLIIAVYKLGLLREQQSSPVARGIGENKNPLETL